MLCLRWDGLQLATKNVCVANSFTYLQHSSSKSNMGHYNRFEDEKRVCQSADGQTEFKELASNIRAMRDKVRLLEKTYEETERS